MSKAEIAIKSLEGGLSLIEKPGGWIRDRLNNGWGGYCALGCLYEAVGYNLDVNCHPAIIALDAAIPADDRYVEYTYPRPVLGPATLSPDKRFHRIASYNNRHDQETVVAWFKKAIRMQREHPMEEVG